MVFQIFFRPSLAFGVLFRLAARSSAGQQLKSLPFSIYVFFIVYLKYDDISILKLVLYERGCAVQRTSICNYCNSNETEFVTQV